MDKTAGLQASTVYQFQSIEIWHAPLPMSIPLMLAIDVRMVAEEVRVMFVMEEPRELLEPMFESMADLEAIVLVRKLIYKIRSRNTIRMVNWEYSDSKDHCSVQQSVSICTAYSSPPCGSHGLFLAVTAQN